MSMNESELRIQAEMTVVLNRVVQDLERLNGLRDEIRELPALQKKVEDLFNAFYIGNGEHNPPLTQRISTLERDVRRCKSANGIGPKERAALYGALLTAVAAALKAYFNGA